MEEYKPNSHKYKAEQKAVEGEKKIEKVVNGQAKVRKKNGMQKLAGNFIAEDVGNVGSYVLFEVLIPAAKKALSDIIVNGTDMILYGETGHSKKRGNASYVSYDRFSSSDRSSERRHTGRASMFDYDDIIFETRGDADDALTGMEDIISAYDVVSVNDLYDLAGISTNLNSQMNKYGWTSLRTAEIVRLGDGYAIKLPKARPLD